jgi:AcrR family transcriptional regulator
VQTIYFAFGNKPSLLKELVDVTIAGDDEPIPTMRRPWFLDALAADTAEAQLRAHVRGTCDVLQRVAPIMDVLRAAGAQDPSLADMWQQDSDPRLEVQTNAARSLVAKPGARAHVSVEHAADLLFGLLSPQLFLLFVRDRGWTPARWERWAYDTLHAQLCG